MNFNQYQLFTKTTAIYPEDQAIPYLVAGLCEEAGEVAGKFKKSVRDKWPRAALESAAAAELGDVLWYVARLADELGYDLEQIAQENEQKLSSRKERGVLQGSGDSR